MNKENDRLTTKQAADFIGCHPVTLQNWRKKGTGPPFIHDGFWVFYPLAGLLEYAAGKHVKNESGKGGNHVRR